MGNSGLGLLPRRAQRPALVAGGQPAAQARAQEAREKQVIWRFQRPVKLPHSARQQLTRPL